MLKTELFVYRNPVLVVVEPDLGMMLYSREMMSRGWHVGHKVLVSSSDTLHELVRLNSSQEALLMSDHLPVYHVTGVRLKPHLVVVLGWGSVPEPHWVVQNSWGETWGDSGRGKIAVGEVAAAMVLDARVWSDSWAVIGVMAVVFMAVSVYDVVVCCFGWGKRVRVKVKVEDTMV